MARKMSAGEGCGAAELGFGISASPAMSWLPDNVLLEVLSFLSVQDLIRSGRSIHQRVKIRRMTGELKILDQIADLEKNWKNYIHDWGEFQELVSSKGSCYTLELSVSRWTGVQKRRVFTKQCRDPRKETWTEMLAAFIWLNIPEKVHVLGYRDRVCKRWKRLVMDKSLWRHVDLTPYKLNSKILWHLVRRWLGTSLQTLKVKGLLNSVNKQEFLTPAILQVIEKRYTSLEKLHLEEINLRSLIYECFPSSLKTLELYHCEIPMTWFRTSPSKNKTFPNLENLVLKNVSSFTNHHLETICKQSSLKTLYLSGIYRVTDIGIQKAVPYLKGLEHLKLHDGDITDITLHLIGCHLKRLRTLALINFRSLTDAGLSCLSDIKTLEKLWLEYCFHLTSNCIIAVCVGLPSLSYLNLNGIIFEGQGVDEIKKSLPNCRITNFFSDVDTIFKL